MKTKLSRVLSLITQYVPAAVQTQSLFQWTGYSVASWHMHVQFSLLS